MPQPTHNISSETAYDLLQNGQALVDVYVQGDLNIEICEEWNHEVVFENCIVEDFSGSTTQFNKHVKMTNCHFKSCQFIFSYFYGGLTIQNCVFDYYLDFQAGGHNQPGHQITISNNEFKGFVNFFDCIYESDILISSNNFQKGCNLLGKPFGIPVSFYTEPVIHDNLGELDLNHEGDYF